MCASGAKYERIPLLPKPEAQVQNVSSAKVYVFGNEDIAEEEINTDGVELRQLRSRGKAEKTAQKNSSINNDELFIEREIQNGETIHSISLKYGCPVAELKRVNNLIRDQDFFALQSIKVPAKRHGLLLELLEQEKQNGIASGALKKNANSSLIEVTENYCDEEQMIGLSDSENCNNTTLEPEIRTLSIRDTLSSQGQDACDFLQQMDSDIKNIVASTKNRLDSLEEVATVLTCRRIFPMRQKKQQTWGADCGIRWWNVVLIVFIIGLVTPLLYFVYYEYVKPT